MLTLQDVRSWLMTLPGISENFSAVFCGFLKTKQERSIGVYPLKERRARAIAIGGELNTKTVSRPFSLLVHYNESSRESEAAAFTVYNAIRTNLRPSIIGDHEVFFIHLNHNEPVYVGMDENGVQEYVIEFVANFRKDDI